MGRLIDADKLDSTLFEEIPLAENVHIFHDMIENQQTAYDVDKVVEKLEKLETYSLAFNDYIVDIQKNGKGRTFVCLQDVLEIVKAGGMNDR